MTLEEKVAAYAELRRKLDELEEQKKLLADEILSLCLGIPSLFIFQGIGSREPRCFRLKSP